ncbi:hypothetical protein ACFQGW_09920 [Xanthomonas theicola]|uniref:hypothetical protein n=1 Tax=Xanthomonas theicola TaxID=56464 RepID=UPI00361111A7
MRWGTPRFQPDKAVVAPLASVNAARVPSGFHCSLCFKAPKTDSSDGKAVGPYEALYMGTDLGAVCATDAVLPNTHVLV